MKHMKMLGLCLAGVLAAMALLGAGTASATKLCSENKSPCPAGSTIKTGAALSGKLVAGTKAVFVTSVLTVECSESTISGKTTNEGGGAGVNVKGEITAVEWKSCVSGSGGACTTTALGLPWLTEVSGTGGSGTMTVSNALGKFSCSGITCEYEAKTASTSVTGGNPAIVKANKVSFAKKSGFFCPATATWSSEYEITTPKPLFVVAE
jgi:hypothetical protein